MRLQHHVVPHRLNYGRHHQVVQVGCVDVMVYRQVEVWDEQEVFENRAGLVTLGTVG